MERKESSNWTGYSATGPHEWSPNNGTQSRFAYFLTVKAVVRKLGKSYGQTGFWCLDKAVLAQGGGGYKGEKTEVSSSNWTKNIN